MDLIEQMEQAELTGADAPQERALLGAALSRLVQAERKLEMLVTLYYSHDDQPNAETMQAQWQTLRALSDAIEQRYDACCEEVA